MDGDNVERVLREFARLGVEYKVFGDVALNLHGLPRFTEDLDVFVAPSSENIEKVKMALREAFDFDSLSAEDVDFRGLAVQVVTPRQLYEMKKGTVRLRDRADAELLNERFGLEG